MKLTYYKGKVPNFGDDLNAIMWDKLVKPGFFNDKSDELFLGIGSILWDDYPSKSKKIVVGSGYGGYKKIPDVTDGTWEFPFVRGPRTAKMLNLDPNVAITDAAILTHYIGLPKQDKKFTISFMPHWESIERGTWQAVCTKANIHYIDPRGDVVQILKEIQQSELLLTEAMHGAILADTLRTPWQALEPINSLHRNKWFDWSESMKLNLNFNSTPPSSLFDFIIKKYNINPSGRKYKLLNFCLSFIKPILIKKAAKQLECYAQEPSQLSSDSVFLSKAEQALSALRGIDGIELNV